MSDKAEQYYKLVEQWLQFYGYANLNVNSASNSDVDKVFTKKEDVLTRFGTVYSYCCIKYMKEASGNDLRIFSGKMFNMASRHRTGLPLGLGAMLVVYPLIITENISPELAEFAKSFCPKHYAATEFPSVLDLNTEYLYYYPKTPVWGYAYYASFRKDVLRFYSPQSWKEFRK